MSDVDGFVPQPPNMLEKPIAPPDYVRPQPAWLVKALAQSELDAERFEHLGVAQQLSAASTTAFLKSHVAAEVSGSTPRLARVLNDKAELSQHRRVSKQQVVPLPVMRNERTRALAGALNLSPRVVSAGMKAQLLLTTTPSALRNGAVESSSLRADAAASRYTRHGGAGAAAAAASSGSQSARRVGEQSPRMPSRAEREAERARARAEAEAAAAAARPSSLSEGLRAKLASELSRVIDLFRAADVNTDGSISLSEFKAAVAQAKLDATESELDELFRAIDADASDEISFVELNRVLRKTAETARPPVPPAAPLPKLSKEGAAVAAGMVEIQKLVDEHERLRHQIRRTRVKASIAAEKAKEKKDADGEDEEEVDATPIHLQAEPPRFRTSEIAACDAAAGNSVGYGAQFGGGVSFAGGGGSGYGAAAGGSRRAAGSKKRGGGGGGGGSSRLTHSFSSAPGTASSASQPAPFKRRTRESTVMQREEVEVMDEAGTQAEERMVQLAQVLSDKRHDVEARKAKLADLTVELDALTKEHECVQPGAHRTPMSHSHVALPMLPISPPLESALTCAPLTADVTHDATHDATPPLPTSPAPPTGPVYCPQLGAGAREVRPR